MSVLVECVPNFSEGRCKDIIDSISNAICQTKGCHLLDVDPGVSTNRTVYTFVGEPGDVVTGALAAAKIAYNLIDMKTQKGEHPRIGAMDVCPFIPIRNITIEECVDLSKKFGKLLSEELDVPVFLYGESQPLEYRKELSSIRQGEYEALEEILKDPKMKPDFGPAEFRPKYGATCVGARHFLIAYNINILGTKEQAHRIALNIREQGRSEKEPGRCPKVKAIGWWLEEENMAQISMNLIDFKTTNLHHVFEECDKDAKQLKLATCGSQIVGLIPLESILLVADYYIEKEKLMILEEDIKVKLAIERLGLNSITKFNPKERIIEYMIKERLINEDEKYQNLSLKDFTNLVGARSSLPGGGCVSALVGALGSSLSCMCALLTFGNRKFEMLDPHIRQVLPSFFNTYHELLKLVDQDAVAFNSFVDARRLSCKTTEEQIKKNEKIDKALFKCIEVPYTVMKKCHQLWPFLRKLAPIFNTETKSDLQVGVKCLETAIFGAYSNVEINLKGANLSNSILADLSDDAKRILTESRREAEEISNIINERN